MIVRVYDRIKQQAMLDNFFDRLSPKSFLYEMDKYQFMDLFCVRNKDRQRIGIMYVLREQMTKSNRHQNNTEINSLIN